VRDPEIINELLLLLAGNQGLGADMVGIQRLLSEGPQLEALIAKATQLGYQCSKRKDEEHSTVGLALRRSVEAEIRIDFDFLVSAEFQRLITGYRQICGFDQPPFLVKHNGSEKLLGTRERLLDYIVESGKNDLTIQRYKGLGEMNPEQLWETTMNPETRTLLQVSVDDAVETDEIFTILMGDAVDPRRKFIEENALNVHNLDI
jgi:DNA gyrase subunit B